MASLSTVIQEFKSFKSKPILKGALSAAFQGIKNKVIVLIPVGIRPELRWNFMLLLLQLIWSPLAPGSIVTGAFLSLLTLFSEQPAQLLRLLIGDPDIEVQVVDVVSVEDGRPRLATRGSGMSEVELRYQRIAQARPDGSSSNIPFIVKDLTRLAVTTVEELQIAVGTVTLQVWILLTKAVTAPDTARDSEQRRWLKYVQQRRADRDYKLEFKWLDYARQRIAADLPVRRFMVDILIEVTSSSGTKSRIVEMIADIGSYISEAGMAGFFLTIKYGIETRYPALALNELQGDLATLLELMKYYRQIGERGPYLVILEDSAQVRFAPGNYPLLYSYAMGVGTTLDKSMAGLIYDKGYVEPSFFRLGRKMVHKLEGNVDARIAEELKLTTEQRIMLKDILQSKDDTDGVDYSKRKPIGGTNVEPITINEEMIPVLDDDSGEEDYDRLSDTNRHGLGRYDKKDIGSHKDYMPESSLISDEAREALYNELNEILEDRGGPIGTVRNKQMPNTDVTESGDDLDVMRHS
nr:nucleocapsid protein [Paramyxoviridae sp.]